MNVAQKNLSSSEALLYITPSLPIIGTFLFSPENQNNLPLLENIAATDMAKTLLLTADFLYLKSNSSQSLEELKLLAMAEIDDYISSSPEEKTADTGLTETKIDILIKTIIAPFLQKDGGNLEQISYDNGLLKVRFLGKCQTCPYAQRTLKSHVEKNLQRYLPQIREVTLI